MFPKTLSEDLGMQIGKLPRVGLANLPTPLQKAENLTKSLGGPTIYIKRDDLTGLAFGGNKTRILELVMGDAKAKGADAVVAGAGWQSNWCSQVAAAANKLGMKAFLYKRAVSENYDPDYDGNQLLQFLLDADIRAVGPPWNRMEKAKTEIMERLIEEGHKPYDANASPYASIGYVNGVLETINQANSEGYTVNHIVTATGSGMTLAGLLLGSLAMNTGIDVLGVSITPSKDLPEEVADRVNTTAKLMNLEVSVAAKDVNITEDYIGGGYAVVNEDVAKAIKLVAKTEGIFLDPVYTGKAMAGLIDLCKKGYFNDDETVVFLHTGGNAALFPYRDPIKAMLKSTKAPWVSPPWFRKE